MKLFFAYSVLFCLVFLNVPRELVHDCNHDHVTHGHSEDHQHGDEQIDLLSTLDGSSHTHLENEDCFVCEFDLGFFELTVFAIPKFIASQFEPIVGVESDRVNRTDFSAFPHRGPPQLFNV